MISAWHQVPKRRDALEAAIVGIWEALGAKPELARQDQEAARCARELTTTATGPVWPASHTRVKPKELKR